ncbi:hypothetical protein GJ744_005542 [Endocarpon pusillum]|uniref:Peptidase A1 domain-containing protein n=1 Tax=Endocarpon pusillum TaxID=364733 RepID=A0A8H7AQ35_9EURO|nr:hypothetical protein GJ744_005542 [Endocarpon pusillum]
MDWVSRSYVLSFFVYIGFFSWLPTSRVSAQINLAPSQNWDGNDGPWSTFEVQIGTPPQVARVLMSNLDSSLWVPVPEGCNKNDPPDCPEQRGGLYSYNDSSTWKESGLYALPLQARSFLGYSGNSKIGVDNIMLGGIGSGAPSIGTSVVTGIVEKDFFLGHLGLNHRALNISNLTDQHRSPLTSLFEDKKIPSLTWSYTAGAYYRDDKTYGSLILGGYDATRSDVRHNLTVKMPVNTTRDLRLAITAISSHGTSLLDSEIYAFIDSSIPHIWLPIDACTRFEEAFGLIYDNATQRYRVNDTLHTNLLRSNASVVISVASSTRAEEPNGSVIDITLPYGAFDKMATESSDINSTWRYFPLRQASNSSQYTLGRTFLQEAYLHVDYGRSVFTVSQTLFPSDPADPGNIIAVFPGTNSTDTSDGADHGDGGTPQSPKTNTGMIAGITIGAVLSIGGVIAPGYFYRRYRHRRASRALQDSHGSQHSGCQHSGSQRSGSQRSGSQRSGSQHRADENKSEIVVAELPGDFGQEGDGQATNSHLLDGREIREVRLYRGRARPITTASRSPDLSRGGRTPISERISGSTLKSESDGVNRENREIFELPVQTVQELP